MGGTRRHLGREHFTGIVRTAFDGTRELRGVTRLRGGTSKGVYRLTFADGSTSVGYVWNDEEDYWSRPAGTPGATPARPSAAAVEPTGLDLFEAAHAELSRLGVRVPEILHVDRGGTHVAGAVAIVADIRGGTLESRWQRDPGRSEPILRRLGHAVRVMHRQHRDRYGRPGVGPDVDGAPAVARTVADQALDHLEQAAARVPRIAAVRERLADAVRERLAAVATRHRYGLIHGELGPDHVLVDDHDEPVLIDIEGTRFSDVEWEHAFLELRFGDRYRHLVVEGLDADRMRLYRLAMYLSLVAGPLRLLDGDFPDRAGMLGIVAQNVDRTLAQLD